MKRFTGFLGTALILFLVIFNPAYASAAASSSGLNITPRKNLTIQPGQTVKDKLTIGNLNRNADLNVTFRTVDFSFMDESGSPKLFLAEDAAQTPWSLKPFMNLPKTVVIPAGQSRTVDYSVTIPAGQGAGSYYSAIQYGTGGSDGGQVSLSASGVSLVFVSVPGVVKEDMTLKKFGAYAKQADGITGQYVFVATKIPREMGFTLENKGNVAEAPVGSINVKYMLGGKEWKIEDANPSSSLALRGQTRLFTACLESETKTTELGGTVTKAKVCKNPKMWPGRYTATLGAFYGQNGNNTHEVNGTASFWYLPIWFIATAIVLLVLVGIALTIVTRKIRRAIKGPGYGKNRR
jgi:hypothetical protein